MAAVSDDPTPGGAAIVAAATRQSATSWQDAIMLACGLLADRDAVTAEYATRCIEMVEEHGPYIVLTPRIALAHARPEDGVLRLGLSVVTLTEPVSFGHPENDPVDIVFAFGSPDRTQHVGLLAALARALLDGLEDDLRAASDDEEAREVLERIDPDG